ncbi:SIS domain-containing protein [Gammaproteobacteria bacterium]|jgi:D-sedoheptulose 7-phosphate isomerase|nr:SIS domain-containing protein [Gammaproteobacteria bacterium]
MTIEIVKQEIINSLDVKKLLLDESLMNQILDLANKCIESLGNGGKIIFCGNGGSFADAQHLSAEFTSRFIFDRPGLASIALGTNSSAMTAIGNDYGYDNVFSREIEAIASQEDLIIGITTSGNSSNILKAIEAAQDKKVELVILTGSGSGKLPDGVSMINVPSSETARIQECHILIGHIICGIVEEEIFGKIYNNN